MNLGPEPRKGGWNGGGDALGWDNGGGGPSSHEGSSGKTSGFVQKVKEIRIDDDQDSVWLTVDVRLM